MTLIYIMKICTNLGGTERVLSDKMNYFAEIGYNVSLITYSQGKHPLAFPLHENVKHYDLNTKFFELYKYGIIRRIYKHIKMRRLFKQRLQELVERLDPDYMIATTYDLEIINLIGSIKTNANKFIESHIAFHKAQTTENHNNGRITRLAAKLFNIYILSQIKKFDRLISLTEGDAKMWQNYIRNVSIIPDPVTYYPESISEELSKKSTRIICVGRLTEQKGFDLLIEAFALISEQCPEWHIDIFGKGKDELFLKEMITKKHLDDRIKINKPTKSIYDEYLKSAFYVLSSRYEGFALVLNEAMSCGLPCVSFDCKYGPSEAICHGKNGLLVENGNTAQLGEAILWMIQHPAERYQMKLHARMSSAKYKKEIIMKKWIQLFEESIRNKSNQVKL